MRVEQGADGAELEALRKTRFYRILRPYVRARLAPHRTANGHFPSEADEHALSVGDRYFAKLDILFGQVFQNVRTRGFWKYSLERLQRDGAMSLLALAATHRAYINELVALVERLSRFLVLVQKALGDDVALAGSERDLIRSFNPLVFADGNFDQHRLYMGLPGYSHLASLEQRLLEGEECVGDEYNEILTRKHEEIMAWVDCTEKSLAAFLPRFLDALHDAITKDGVYREPLCLPESFSMGDRLKSNLRRGLREGLPLDEQTH